MSGRETVMPKQVSNDDLWRIHDAQIDWTGNVDTKAACP